MRDLTVLSVWDGSAQQLQPGSAKPSVFRFHVRCWAGSPNWVESRSAADAVRRTAKQLNSQLQAQEAVKAKQAETPSPQPVSFRLPRKAAGAWDNGPSAPMSKHSNGDGGHSVASRGYVRAFGAPMCMRCCEYDVAVCCRRSDLSGSLEEKLANAQVR